ncbi:MAG: hypothetical protein BKP49_06035 [Treponema sp. CETP13]|nr:MAG: hypothetical protein BKP49_06035 [Treponema sp. CETP13]
MNKKLTTLFVLLSISMLICTAQNIEITDEPDLSITESEPQKTLVIIGYPRYYNLDPHTANYSSDAQVLNGLYEGLFTFNAATAEPETGIAKSFKISRNSKIWTFYLPDDITFSDGTPITANDVKRSLLTEIAPETKAPFASLLDCVEGAAAYRKGEAPAETVKIHARNDTTLVITLTEPTAHFSSILAHHAFSVMSQTPNVYSGAYVLESETKTKTVLVKNENYHDAKNVNIERIEFRGTEDAAAATWALNTGEAQWLSSIFSTDLLYNQQQLIISAQYGTEFMFFRDNREPWNDPELRNAILTAIPWNKLRSGNIVLATTLILPLTNYPSIIGLTDYDPDLASEMMLNAGYSAEDNLTLKLAIPNYEHSEQQANIIKEGLAKIGVTVEIELCDPESYLDSFDSIDSDMLTYTWIGDFADPLAFLELFRKDSTLRETNWTNEEFEKLITEASAITDTTARYKKLSQAEQVLIDSGIIVPISHPVATDCIDTDILGGWYSNVLDIHPLKSLYFKEPSNFLNFVMNLSFDPTLNLCYND